MDKPTNGVEHRHLSNEMASKIFIKAQKSIITSYRATYANYRLQLGPKYEDAINKVMLEALGRLAVSAVPPELLALIQKALLEQQPPVATMPPTDELA